MSVIPYSVSSAGRPEYNIREFVPDLSEWPRISIVTPNCNYGHLVEATVRSVLSQEYPNLEYIVIDDGSTDDSLQVIEKYATRLGYFGHRENKGQYATINEGFSKATGEVFGWINSDDIYLPWTLRAVSRVFARFPDVNWIVGAPSTIQDGIIHAVSRTRPYPVEMIRAGLFNGGESGFGWIQQESCFWRRSLWERAGGLDESLHYAADFELWTRFARFGELYSVSTLLGGFTHRSGANRSSANRDRYMDEVNKVTARLRSNPRSPEARLAQEIESLRRMRRTFGTGAIARRFLVRKGICGPILRWNFKESCYELMRPNFF